MASGGRRQETAPPTWALMSCLRVQGCSNQTSLLCWQALQTATQEFIRTCRHVQCCWSPSRMHHLCLEVCGLHCAGAYKVNPILTRLLGGDAGSRFDGWLLTVSSQVSGPLSLCEVLRYGVIKSWCSKKLVFRFLREACTHLAWLLRFTLYGDG